MKRLIPLLVLFVFTGYLLSPLFPRKAKSDFDLTGFGRLPVLVNGRLKPMDTVARTTLLIIQNRQRVSTPVSSEEFVDSPIEWLVDVLFRAEKADTYPVFAIDNTELLSLLGFTEESLKINYTDATKRTLAIVGFIPSTYRRFTFVQLSSKMPELEKQARLAEQVDALARTPFQKAVISLREHLILYLRLKHSLVPPDVADPLREFTEFHQGASAGVAAIRAREKKEPHDEAAARATFTAAQRYDAMARLGYLLAIPPPPDSTSPDAWRTSGAALLETFQTGQLNPTVMAYGGLAHAWRNGQAVNFNTIVKLYRDTLSSRFGERLKKSDTETRFNAAEPFYRSMGVYVVAFLFGVFSWLRWPEVFGRSARYLVALAWIATTTGVVLRMWLEGRPPVTNLYSSALFVGWGSVALCLVLELIYKNAIGSVAAGSIGFCTLLIAHHLSLSGDTLEMMRAVLDSNFWLGTHVVVVTIGYAATFLSGFLALIYVILGVFTRVLDKPMADAMNRMVYGIVCFATLFSLVGTVLGGIWADQSWGRFWGWDPKENGALIIVLWNALILHSRWGGLVRTRGLMALAIAGNIVTSWSWFGTNMLGVGLHSYGFMDAAFYWLLTFVISQITVIGIAQIPLKKWRSFAAKPATPPSAPKELKTV